MVDTRLRALVTRVVNRLARELVTRFSVSPRHVGYRFLETESPLLHPHREIHPETVSVAPLPCNVDSRDRLSRQWDIAGFSFHDVPEKTVAATWVATVRGCRVLTALDAWGDPHYAIVTSDDRVLNVRGTEYEHALHAPLMAAKREARLERATWILEQWDHNYAHWIQWHLVKIPFLQKLGLAEDIVLAGSHPLESVVSASLASLGVVVSRLQRFSSAVLAVDEMTVVGMDACRPSLVQEIRSRFARGERPATRMVFVSRGKAKYRRLHNEEACWAILEESGFERVFLEDLAFLEQVALMQETVVVFGLHGAGLANILFAPAGIHVLEISDLSFPNPQIYALASALGQHYWMLTGQPEGAFRPGYHDVSCDPEEVRRVLAQVEAACVREGERMELRPVEL